MHPSDNDSDASISIDPLSASIQEALRDCGGIIVGLPRELSTASQAKFESHEVLGITRRNGP